MHFWMTIITAYGRPMIPFFHWNSELLGLGKQIEQIKSGAFGVFLAKLSAPILVQWVPCLCFPLCNHYFYKKLSLSIYILNIFWGLGLEFGPQRIMWVRSAWQSWLKETYVTISVWPWIMALCKMEAPVDFSCANAYFFRFKRLCKFFTDPSSTALWILSILSWNQQNFLINCCKGQ